MCSLLCSSMPSSQAQGSDIMCTACGLFAQVHRYHPPLIYGRTMAGCEPETSTGIAVCRVKPSRLAGSRGEAAYIAVTYEQPHTSARIVPRVQEFAQGWLAAASADDVQ